jgi:hypothetical protein
VEKFLEEYMPLKKLKEQRFAGLPKIAKFLHVDKNLSSVFYPYLMSRRLKDLDNQTYVRFKIDIANRRFGYVTASSPMYCLSSAVAIG